MSFSFRQLTEDDVQQFVSWHYDPPYDIYNLGEKVTSDDMAYFLDRQYQYHVMLDKAGTIIAFCSFGKDGQVSGGDYSADALDIGMGLRPDLTGQGSGIDYVQSVVAFALDTFAPNALRVTIAEFNLRAQTVWQKAGFEEMRRFNRERDQKPFVIYVLQKPSLNQL